MSSITRGILFFSIVFVFDKLHGTELTTTDLGISNSGTGISPDDDHSFMIQLYDNYLEIDITIESKGQERYYAVIVTEEDCSSKYKFVSLDLMMRTIRDAIDDEADKSMTSYKIKVIGRDKLELTVLYDGNMEKLKFSLFLLKRKGISQEVKMVNHLERQIYELKKRTKVMKGMMVPKYGVIMYSKCSKIPKGFTLCDGTRGTPDLRDQFVIEEDEICDSETCLAATNDTDKATNSVYKLCYIMRV